MFSVPVLHPVLHNQGRSNDQDLSDQLHLFWFWLRLENQEASLGHGLVIGKSAYILLQISLQQEPYLSKYPALWRTVMPSAADPLGQLAAFMLGTDIW